MDEDGRILIGKGETPQHLVLRRANRHGLIAGATGTGKTVTLQTLIEGFSRHGVPTFVADVKGDLAGLCQPGAPAPRIVERCEQLGLGPFQPAACPAILWDVFGEQGHPVRTTISEMGPLLLARLLELNDTQSGVLNLVFKLADDEGLLLLDLKDLRSMLGFVAEQADSLTVTYGNVSKASIGAIQRALLALETQGGDVFFGEPALELADLMRVDAAGRGYVGVLAADKLMQRPRLYATMLLWMLSELFEELPEVGDLDKPKLAFFFDEAHLLFDDAPKALVEQIEQVVRLIRSKGVGVYFVTQNPLDVADEVLGQLGNRVQHALRAFTPRDQRVVRAAAETFRPNPRFSTMEAITALGVGEALVSTLDARGSPTMVERSLIRPPQSRLGPITAAERASIVAASPLAGRYERAIDRESAHEELARRAAGAVQTTDAPPRGRSPLPPMEERPSRPASPPRRGRTPDTLLEAMAKSAVRSIGSRLGREIVRGLFGALSRKR